MAVMNKKLYAALLGLLLVWVVLGCTPPGSPSAASTYTVTYYGNNNTGGSVPTDPKSYHQGDAVTILDNTGSLVRTGDTFTGWNTQATGGGATYAAGQTLTMGSSNVTLYAMWATNPTYTVTYYSNGSTFGTAPTDSKNYQQGATVTVMFAGSLVDSGSTFAGWMTKAGGSGTSYNTGATFPMGSSSVSLYPIWIPNNLVLSPDNSGSVIGITGYTVTPVGSLVIPNGVTTISSPTTGVFASCTGLTSVTIPASLTSIGNSTFLQCTGLTTVIGMVNVTSIGQMAFDGCSALASITIPASLSSIGPYVFAGCTALTSVTIPASVNSIGNSAFESIGVTSVTIPASVNSIGAFAFGSCSRLTSVNVLATTPPALMSGSQAFDFCGSGLKIYVPYDNQGSIVAAYKAATGWSDYSSKINSL